MSVAALMMVKDEIDVIDTTLAHLTAEVDQIYVLDNRSSDGTSELLHVWEREKGATVTVIDDPEVAYEQSQKMTALAHRALDDGHEWVVPVDADEIWTAPEAWRLGDYLEGHAPDVQAVRATLFDHVPTDQDNPAQQQPQIRLGWRRRNAGVLPKVCARTHPKLVIHPGNHGVEYGPRRFLQVDGLRIDHFTWRTPEQYLRKIRNGLEAYAPVERQDIGVHWRMFENATDEAIVEHFHEWFFVTDPGSHAELLFDPLEWNTAGALEPLQGAFA